MKFFTVVSIVVTLTLGVSSKSFRASTCKQCKIKNWNNFITSCFILASITDAELLSLSNTLHSSDVNGAVVVLNLQGQTTAGSFVDLAPNR